MRILSFLSIIAVIAQVNAKTLGTENADQASAPVHVINAAEAETGKFFVREWLALGPFENPHRKLDDGDFTRAGFADNLLADQFPDESTIRINPESTYTTTSGFSMTPELLVAQENGVLNLIKRYGEVTEKVVYLFAWIESEEEQEIYILFSSDDSSKVWINGKLEHESWYPTGRGIIMDREILRVNLHKGKNAVLVKVEQLSGGWGIVMRAPPREKVVDFLLTRLSLTPQVMESTMLDGGRWLTLIQPGLSVQGLDGAAAASLYPDLPQKITIKDTNGVTLYAGMHNMGDSIPITTDSGGFYIEVTSTDGSELIGYSGFLLGHDAIAYAQERLALLDDILAHGLYPAYAGWLHFIASSLKSELQKDDPQEEVIRKLAVRLAYWQGHAVSGADLLDDMRGIVEWAYLSKVDNSGQPFTIMIPEHYTPEKEWPLLINMHGAGGDHGAAWGKSFKEEWIQVNVNGRGPVGRYVGLSEIDVLEVIQFVKANWIIDDDQVHLSGGSMGGYGTFSIASRHPDLFASATPFCGNGSHVPTENMLHVPTHAVHSIDDMVVVVSGARSAIERLNAVGGTATMDETDGYGHAIHNWKEGAERAREWRRGKVRVPANEVYRVIYTALDESARRAYWASIEEFGPAHDAACMDVRVDRFNGLYANLDNVNILKIDVAQVPLNPEKPLLVSINNQYVNTLPAPLPNTLYLLNTGDGWEVSGEGREPLPYRLRFPGGMTALYHGEPFMIVYGSIGDSETTDKLKTLADAGSRMPRPSWSARNVMSQMPFGRIPVKRDTDVTAEDIAMYNLILLGLPSENSLVAEIAGDLPITLADDGRAIHSNDGHKWTLDGRGFGLLHFNPKAPQKLIYWIGSATAAFYQADSAFFDFQSGLSADPDFLLMDAVSREIATARCFDSHWQWEAAYSDSPLLTDVLNGAEYEVWLADKLNTALGTHSAVVRKSVIDQDSFSMQRYSFSQEARLADVAATEFSAPIGVMELSGEELTRILESFNKAKNNVTAFIPEIDADSILSEKRYRVCVPNGQMRRFIQAIGWAPSSYSITGITMREILLRNE